jgi:predicted RND superfamily exporter protein
MKLPVKIVVVVAFLALLAVNIYGASQIKLDFDYEWFVDKDHELQDTFEIRDDYFEEDIGRVTVYTVD